MAQYMMKAHAKKPKIYAVAMGVMSVLHGGLSVCHSAYAAATRPQDSPTRSTVMGSALPQGWMSTAQETHDRQKLDNSAEEAKLATPEIRLAEQSLKADMAAHKAKMAGVYEKLKHREDGLVKEQKNLDAQWSTLKQKMIIATAQEGRLRRETEQSVMRLAHIYEQMPPREAAYMFNILDMRAMLPVARHMLPRKLSDIMGKMAPERASILSQYLAGRRQIEDARTQLLLALAKSASQK